MLRSELSQILTHQQANQTSGEVTIIRDKFTQIPRALVISGVRRCGKSTFLKQIAEDSDLAVGFIHFDDPRLTTFEVEDFYLLEELWSDKEAYQFDEVQQVEG